MPTALKPADDRNQTGSETRSRSPHPYLRHGNLRANEEHLPSGYGRQSAESEVAEVEDGDRKQTQAMWSTASESGTEADDERPHLLKALPSSEHKPRKGLRDSYAEGTASPLLTPSQLDHDGSRLSNSYFEPRQSSNVKRAEGQEDLEAERRKHEKRRQAERLRRVSEGALLGFIGLVVCCGPSVWTAIWRWHSGQSFHPAAKLPSNGS